MVLRHARPNLSAAAYCLIVDSRSSVVKSGWFPLPQIPRQIVELSRNAVVALNFKLKWRAFRNRARSAQTRSMRDSWRDIKSTGAT